MRYCFAGAYERRGELAMYASVLHAENIGATVVSRWLTQDQAGGAAGFSTEGMKTAAGRAAAWAYGQRDIEDLSNCQAIVSFTGEGTRGGRHVEHGMAISYRDNHPWDLSSRSEPMRLIVIGPREHVFHCHPATEVYPNFEAFLNHEIQQNREETE